jgi:hypothetical protein
LHLSHSFLTEARTFIGLLTFHQYLYNSSARPVLDAERDTHSITHSQTHKIRALCAREVSNYLVLTFQPNSEQRTGQKFDDYTFGMTLIFYHSNPNIVQTQSARLTRLSPFKPNWPG